MKSLHLATIERGRATVHFSSMRADFYFCYKGYTWRCHAATSHVPVWCTHPGPSLIYFSLVVFPWSATPPDWSFPYFVTLSFQSSSVSGLLGYSTARLGTTCHVRDHKGCHTNLDGSQQRLISITWRTANESTAVRTTVVWYLVRTRTDLSKEAWGGRREEE